MMAGVGEPSFSWTGKSGPGVGYLGRGKRAWLETLFALPHAWSCAVGSGCWDRLGIQSSVHNRSQGWHLLQVGFMKPLYEAAGAPGAQAESESQGALLGRSPLLLCPAGGSWQEQLAGAMEG